MTINFINYTDLPFALNGVNSSDVTAPVGQTILCCNDNYCSLSPGQIQVSITNITSFYISSSDCAFAVDLSKIGAQENALIGGPNQSNYQVNLNNVDSVLNLVIDYKLNANNVTFLNNTQETITIEGIYNTIDPSLFLCLPAPSGSQNSLSCGSGFSLKPGNGYASILFIDAYTPFRLSASDFVFDLILGPTIVTDSLSAPSTQSNYAVGLSFDSVTGYTVEINSVLNANSLIIENSTDEIMNMLFDSLSSLITNPGGSATLVGGYYQISPGLAYFSIDPTVENFILSAVDYSYTIDLTQAAGAIENDFIIGASQGEYGAYLYKSGTQSKVKIRKIPKNISLEILNFTPDDIEINVVGDLADLFYDCEYEFSCNTNYKVNPGYGISVLENFPIFGTFSITGSDFQFSNLNLSSQIAQNSGYEVKISQFGTLHSILIEKGGGSIVAGPIFGTLQFYNNSNEDYFIVGINSGYIQSLSNIEAEASDYKIPSTCNNNNGAPCVGFIDTKSFPGQFQIVVGNELATFDVTIPKAENPTATSNDPGYNFSGLYDANGAFYKICVGSSAVPCNF
jgi:hypothetical protein